MLSLLALRTPRAARPIARIPPTVTARRSKRYEAFEASFNQEELAEARCWYRLFDPSQLPKGNTVFARSSGPGGQHVNKTESKATTAYPISELLSKLPKVLHLALRTSKYYSASNDCLTFHAQTQRSRSANLAENREKLAKEIERLYSEHVPEETSADKKRKHQEIQKRFHQARLQSKKQHAGKKQSRKGPTE